MDEAMECTSDPIEAKDWDLDLNYPRLKKSARIAAIVYMTESISPYGLADKQQLKSLWETLEYDVRELRNPTRGGLMSWVTELVAEINVNPMEHDAFNFAFIGHGNCRKVDLDGLPMKCEYMVLNTELNATTVFSVTELLVMFTGFNCPGLANCPKTFLFQCCRGDKKEYPVHLSASSDITVSQWSDMYCFHGSAPGHVSYYDEITGKSFLITTICEVFLNYYQNQDFERMVTTVNRMISRKKTADGNCQTPFVSHGSLTKRLVFFGDGGSLSTVRESAHLLPQSAGGPNYVSVSSAAHSSSQPNPRDEAVRQAVPEGLCREDYEYSKVMMIIHTEMRKVLHYLFAVACPKLPEQTLLDYLRCEGGMSQMRMQKRFSRAHIDTMNNDPSCKSFNIALLGDVIPVSCSGLTTDIKYLVKEIKNIRNDHYHKSTRDHDIATVPKQLQEMGEKLYHAVSITYGVDVTQETWQMKTAIFKILNS